MCHNGNSPSLQDIVNGTSLKSRGGHVTAILQKLEDAGYLKYYGIRQIEMSTIYLMNDRIPPTPTIGEIIQ